MKVKNFSFLVLYVCVCVSGETEAIKARTEKRVCITAFPTLITRCPILTEFLFQLEKLGFCLSASVLTAYLVS